MPKQAPGLRVRAGRWSYGVWLAQGMLLKVINLPVSQMSGAGEGRKKGWKSPDNCTQGKAI